MPAVFPVEYECNPNFPNMPYRTMMSITIVNPLADFFESFGLRGFAMSALSMAQAYQFLG